LRAVQDVAVTDLPAVEPQPGEPPRGELSPRLSASARLVQGLRVPMRDGVELSLDLLRPDLPGRLPVVLYRTPYDKVGRIASKLSGPPETRRMTRSANVRRR
jgi:predicted acyl esterase